MTINVELQDIQGNLPEHIRLAIMALVKSTDVSERSDPVNGKCISKVGI
ncbi:MAG: hypothetical protein HQ515_16490 [Phycisphaeraceae bacterium]|nr:hypothetical protein [Phycisphaeraceae bacterium]